ncbi:MAG: hypothetical protein AMS21_13520 [Gemmatimonas sp. SG8_38_2]|nr:MAG: hypothetical protein AMS21_13520 [Gemmatimonas sp. SG8_38_2]
MRSHAIHITLALTAALFASNLYGQGAGGPCPNVYPEPRVGHFADVVFSNAQDERMPIRFAVVGKESIDGVTHYCRQDARSARAESPSGDACGSR